MAKVKSLSLRVQWLGSRLKNARHQAGYTLDEAAAYLEVTGATVSRFEKGTMKVRRPYLKDLIDFYGIVDRRERDVLFQLSEDAWRRDWWDGDIDDLEMGFLDYTWLESRAAHIRVFEPLIVHGLLQTSEYAQAVLERGNDASTSNELSRLIELRTARQHILGGQDPTQFSVVLEEPALRRPVGGNLVHRGQLRHLLSAVKQANIEVRLLPMSVDWDPGYSGPFTVFEMPDPYPDVAFIEGVAGRTFFEVEAKVQLFQRTYAELEQLALTPRESTKFMRAIEKELE